MSRWYTCLPALTTGPGVVFPCSYSTWNSGSKKPTSSARSSRFAGFHDVGGSGGAGGGRAGGADEAEATG